MNINPRALYQEQGSDAIAAYLQMKGGYVAQTKALQYFCNLLWFYTPMLIEGERGAGKTALAEAVADSFELPIFELNCNSATNQDDMLGVWNRELQGFYSTELRAEGHLLDSISSQINTTDFFDKGVILEAFDFSVKNEKPCVLLIDEVDKLDERAEDFLLKILARGFHTVPRLKPSPVIGFPSTTTDEMRFNAFPFVIATSNNMRGGLSSPLRSRFSCTFMKSPTQEEMVEVVLTRVPALESEKFQPVFIQLVRLIDSIRALALQEKPALREFINFANRIVKGRQPVLEITRKFLDENLDALAKTEKDAEVFHARLDGLIDDSQFANKQLTSGVQRGEGAFVTAEYLVGKLLDNRYQMQTNLNQFFKISNYENRIIA